MHKTEAQNIPNATLSFNDDIGKIDDITEVSEFLCVRLVQSHPPLGERL